MDELSKRVVEAFRDLDYEVQATSFEDITSEGEIAGLREHLDILGGDSGKILQGFPTFFVLHRSACPDKGAFFVVLRDKGIPFAKGNEVYKKYFPKDVLVVDLDPKMGLVAAWMDSTGVPKPLHEVIRQRVES
jgi:hypothetical protein